MNVLRNHGDWNRAATVETIPLGYCANSLIKQLDSRDDPEPKPETDPHFQSCECGPGRHFHHVRADGSAMCLTCKREKNESRIDNQG